MKLPLIAAIFAVSNWNGELGLIFSGVLALVGIIGIVVAICTLKIIARQTKATEIAANAAKTSADALIASERAWIMVDINWEPGHHISETNGSTAVFVKCICSNEGKTPAKIYEKRICLFVTRIDRPLPKEPNLDIEIVDAVPHYLQSSEPSTHSWAFAGDGTIVLGNMGVIYGVVKYWHMFSDHEVQTTFGYRIGISGNLERLTDYPKYNENT